MKFKEKVLGQYTAELTQKYDEEMQFGSKKKAKKILKELKELKQKIK